MKPGDLVWHVHDLEDGVFAPGLVTFVGDDDVSVLVTDNQRNEVHIREELTMNLSSDSLGKDNIMGNPYDEAR